ncbi:DUF3919 family protein [Paenibacillus oryzisoli]|uniref:DUF3919 family protein n=1 Tax=Paenibacillus oryzisoli TaxID=1850517 RepID=UPI003D2915BE
MQEEKKGLSWMRLIFMQIVIGCVLIGIFAFVFRVGVDEVRVLPGNMHNNDMAEGIPMRMSVTYPGVGTTVIEDPKELIAWKDAFAQLLHTGTQRNHGNASRLLLSGSMAYLDQEDIQFQVGTSGLSFGSMFVGSMDISAEIRKLQNMLIDKALTAERVGAAIANMDSEVFRLEEGVLTPLDSKARAALAQQTSTAVRLIDFSQFSFPDKQPNAHYVVQLTDAKASAKHWLHLDQYDNAYFVVFDLLDETNHKAYFKQNDAS